MSIVPSTVSAEPAVVDRGGLPAILGWRTYILSAVIIGSTTLILAEAAVRMVCLPLSSLHEAVMLVKDQRGYVPMPGARIRFRGMHSVLSELVIWQVNAQGIRAEGWIESAKLPGKFRIATYGDSETFGWSVNLEDTFQRRMERLDRRLEVINFGVPGYNISNISEHVERTVLPFRPELLIYLINPNDLDSPLEISTLTIHSELARRICVLYEAFKERDMVRERRSPARIRAFVAELVRMTEFCEKNYIPLAVALIAGQDRSLLEVDPSLKRYFLDAPDCSHRVFDVSEIFGRYQHEDCHLSREGHEQLAKFFVSHLSHEQAGVDLAVRASRSRAERRSF